MEHAQRALFREYHDRAWAYGLCGGDLFREYGALIHLRTVELREQLHLLVSAAAVVADNGKSFEAMDEALEDQIRRTGKARPDGDRGGDGAPVEKTKPLSPEEQAGIAAMVAANEALWGIQT